MSLAHLHDVRRMQGKLCATLRADAQVPAPLSLSVQPPRLPSHTCAERSSAAAPPLGAGTHTHTHP
eukprot:5930344-Alexandrium_andersonii.AAC.1